MNRAMRRAERKSKPMRNQKSNDSESNSIVFEQKSPRSMDALQILSPEEEKVLMEETIPEMKSPPSRKKSNQNPSTGGTGESDKPPEGRDNKSHQKLIKEVAGLYENVGFLLSMRDPITGLIVIKSAEDRATELVNVAKHHKKFMEVLKRITKGNDYWACFWGHMSMVMAILAVHGRVPIQYALPTLEKLEIDPMEFLAKQQEAANGHYEAAESAAV